MLEVEPLGSIDRRVLRIHLITAVLMSMLITFATSGGFYFTFILFKHSIIGGMIVFVLAAFFAVLTLESFGRVLERRRDIREGTKYVIRGTLTYFKRGTSASTKAAPILTWYVNGQVIQFNPNVQAPLRNANGRLHDVTESQAIREAGTMIEIRLTASRLPYIICPA